MEIYSLIVEMAVCRSEEIVIASNRYPAEIVRSRFLKLRYDHVIYVMDCLEKNTSKVLSLAMEIQKLDLKKQKIMLSMFHAQLESLRQA